MDLVGGGVDSRGGLHFENFGCQNERIWTLRGGVRRATVIVDPPLGGFRLFCVKHRYAVNGFIWF